MEINTVLGFKWKVGTTGDFLLIFGIILVAVMIFAAIRYRIILKEKKITKYQLYLFKLKRFGLSNFQIKILNNMIALLRLPVSTMILDDCHHFEEAIGRFIASIKDENELAESMAVICKDITIIYEKIYHPQIFKKPLVRIQDIEVDQLLYFITNTNNIYFGKIISINEKQLRVQIFHSKHEIQKLKGQCELRVYIWRVGDAEYTFTSQTSGIEGSIASITIPDLFSRDKEFRLPYLDVIIPAMLLKSEPTLMEEPDKIYGTILKLNDYELVIRVKQKLDYKYQYTIDFKLLDFKFNVVSTVIAEKTVEESNLIYYSFKYSNMSEEAKHVLKQYMYEYL